MISSLVGQLSRLTGVPVGVVYTTGVVVLCLLYFYRRILKIGVLTLKRDLTGLFALIQIENFLLKTKFMNMTVPQAFKEQVRKTPHKVLFHFEGRQWTFAEFDELTNKIGNCFTNFGYQAGDEVALFMDSTPEFVAFWLGLAKIGVVPALINNGLRRLALAHSVNTINAKALLFQGELFEAVKEMVASLKDPNLQLLAFGDAKNFTNSIHFEQIDDYIEKASNVDSNYRGQFTDCLLYIYTSGTTGFPKASKIKHARYFTLGAASYFISGVHRNDVLYNSLPLYHSVGGNVGTFPGLIFGVTTVIRRKFSASKFWDDCIAYNCTAALYIGELCRYLLSQPPKPTDQAHSVRLMYGNGLRANIWRSFRSRFKIKDISEFYGQTEGNASLGNVTGKEGACGFISLICPDILARYIYPVTLIKVKEETEEPVRDKNGLCIKCKPNEVGLLVSLIKKGDPLRAFDGYVTESDTKKKILQNVFVHGDEAFASGDLLVMDSLGYLFFKDRIGDTFRWKGNNVSTTEIECIISSITNLSDSVVFGVEIPNCEGRAGMAVIDNRAGAIDVNHLLKQISQFLPPYSVPVFIRLAKEIQSTGTFKLIKTSLKSDGYNIKKFADPVYVLNQKGGVYELLDESTYEHIMSGQAVF